MPVSVKFRLWLSHCVIVSFQSLPAWLCRRGTKPLLRVFQVVHVLLFVYDKP